MRKTKLQALALINDVNKYRTELVTNGIIVNEALRIVQSKMEHLNGNDRRMQRDTTVAKDIEDRVQNQRTRRRTSKDYKRRILNYPLMIHKK